MERPADLLSPDKVDSDSSFRKPSNDAVNRKYRRHQSGSASDSSLDEGSPKFSKSEQDHSPTRHRNDHLKIPENSRTTESHYARDVDIGTTHSRASRDGFEKHSSRHSYVNSLDSRRNDGRRMFDSRHTVESRHSYSQRDSRRDMEMHKEHQREAHRYSDRYVERGKHMNSSRDFSSHRERDRNREQPCEDNIDRTICHDSKSGSFDEKEKRKNKDFIERDVVKRKHVADSDVKDDRKDTLYSPIEDDTKDGGKVDGCLENTVNRFTSLKDEKASSSSVLVSGSSGKVVYGSSDSCCPHPGASNDVNTAATVAAQKAAELVNKNMTGFGAVGGAAHLSTDQKKKLLWGSKKSNTAEEVTKRWDANLFSDPERQEKFNKLMSEDALVPMAYCRV